MKLLLVGNHTCGNRGDGAIIRGLIAELTEQRPDIKIDAYSRFPISSSYLLGQTLTMDPLDQFMIQVLVDFLVVCGKSIVDVSSAITWPAN